MLFRNVGRLVAAWLLRPVVAIDVLEDSISPFYSRPDLRAPWLNTYFHDSTAVQDYLFISPRFNAPNAPDGGPYIFDHLGNLIWSGVDAAGGAGTTNIHNLHVCNYQGRDHLCFWKGLQRGTHGSGLGVIMNQQYQIIKTVQGGSATASADLHEFRLTEDNTALITIYSPQFHDGLWILDSIFQEVSLVDNHVIFEWRSLDYIDPSESHVPARSFKLAGDGSSADTSWDYFHINSIDKNGDGDYLISARHCDTVLKISRLNGSILWRLNGDKSSFQLSDFAFRRQHHARFREETENHTVISLFNNDNDGFTALGPASFGIVVEIDQLSKVATKRADYGVSLRDKVVARAMGNLAYLKNNNILLSWGTDSEMAEFRADGTEVWHANVGWKSFNYRAHKNAWVGSPSQPPALWTYARSTKSQLVHYVSWNGATEVHKWRFYASNSKTGPYELVGTGLKSGFETVFKSFVYKTWTFVEAMSAQNVSLRNSSRIRTYVPDGKVAATCGSSECFPAPVISLENEQHASGVLEISGTRDLGSCSRPVVWKWAFWRGVELLLQFIGAVACVAGGTFAVSRAWVRRQRYTALASMEI